MERLVEREEPLRGLQARLRRAASGRGGVVVVRGEPGIGKSALVSALLASVPAGGRSLLGRCDDLATPRPLGALREALGQEPAPSATGADVAAGLVEELRSAATGTPTLLVLEDVHWADQATLDAVTVLGRRAARLPLLLVLTLRPGELADGHPLPATLEGLAPATTMTVEPQPLSRSGVAALARAYGKADPGGEEARRVHVLSAGNPLYALELLAAGLDPAAPSLQHVVRGRVARLPPATRQALEVLALSPSWLPYPVLDRVHPEWASALEPAERHGLLRVARDGLGFHHELVRLVLASQTGLGRQRLLHRRLLSALEEAGAEATVLVHHAEVAVAHALPAVGG
ncbi:AAA family ATPase, partial [Ornithinicoccus halotolerans]|uniref:AAA family ATPase n=1 Tax=Ornithinicoccus halotolerans TaxID=1748220 RepID=UPI0012966D77